MRSNHRILIVDDDPMNADILEEILEDKYKLATAETGEKTLEMLPTFRPDLVLLDIMLPGIDGYEVCKRIKADERYSFIKIILVSGKAMLEERLKGYEVGADDYITKPFVEEELDAKVQAILRLKRAEEVDQIKADLLALFSHETRTPLTSIIGFAKLLREDDSLNDDAKTYVDIIIENSDRLFDYVKKTELLCNLKKGTKLHKTNESIMMHLRVTIAMLEKTVSQKNITFKLDTGNDIDLNVDWNMLDKVLGYVVENAVKYSPDGGIVTAQIETTDESCQVQISDQGAGIEPEWIDKIFDEFAIQDIQHHKKGQGLSLAISRNIMELHGGEIQVESTPGNGATFRLSLPVTGIEENF